MFKWRSSHRYSSLYSFGIERVACHLGQQLDLPIPDTYLENVESHDGMLMMRAPGRTWAELEDQILEARATFVDRMKWPLACVFDIFAANPDRHLENIMVQWDPPMQRRPAHGEFCSTWLIDYGFGGLWPPVKFGDTYDRVDRIPVDADWTDFWLNRWRVRLPPQFRMAWLALDDETREEVIEKVARISDDQLQAAVREVPAPYFTTSTADRTIAFLAGRRDRIGSLVNAVFAP